ncbi:MAG: lysophospholipase [Solirubrobacterales bacterium]|nr:lysophospholipase [Solirubrobacterales bacterium]
MTRKEGHLRGVGELGIYWQAWLPDHEPRGVVVVSHGAGEHSGRYRHVAARLVSEGHAVYAIDHRGHGRSDGPRALIDRIDNAVADLAALVALAADELPGKPLFLLGHSMGGTIAVCFALRHQQRLAGLILSGPLAAIEGTSPAQRTAGRLISALAPRLPLVAIDPNLISSDTAVVRAYRSDPLVHHRKLPARTAAELVAAVERFPQQVASIRVPTLIAYGTGDRLCPPAGSVMLGERIGAHDKTLNGYEGLAHEVLNEPEQERVLDDICAWLTAHTVQALPA